MSWQISKYCKKVIDWIATDGLLHIETSFIIAIITILLTSNWWLGVIVGNIFGILKEVYDKRKRIVHDQWSDTISFVMRSEFDPQY
jgi:hypothetical protein